jgi:hypothetical protein
MDLQTLLELANGFSRLGDAIGEQITDLADCYTATDIDNLIDRGELNANVLTYAEDYFKLARDRDVEGADDALTAITEWRRVYRDQLSELADALAPAEEGADG